MPKTEEHVLVVRRELFDRLGSFQGFSREVDAFLPEFLKRENNHFEPRSLAETNPALKQLIPYAVFCHGGRILHYTRGASSGEKRLVAKASIGIGGHINDGDETLFSFDREAYHTAVRREIAEELQLTGGFTERAAGMINDDSTEVGRVHLGIVHIVDLESPDVQAGEKAIAQLGFATPSEIIARREEFETWSQILMDHFGALGLQD